MNATPQTHGAAQEPLAALLPAREPGEPITQHLARLSGFRAAMRLVADRPDVDVEQLRWAAWEASAEAIRDEADALVDLAARWETSR